MYNVCITIVDLLNLDKDWVKLKGMKMMLHMREGLEVMVQMREGMEMVIQVIKLR